MMISGCCCYFEKNASVTVAADELEADAATYYDGNAAVTAAAAAVDD